MEIAWLAKNAHPVVIVLVFLVHFSISNPCLSPDKIYQDESSYRCFKLFTDKILDWSHARVACQLWGGDLASVSSFPEGIMVNSFWNTTWWRIWIGAHSTETYRWLDDENEDELANVTLQLPGDHYPSHCVYLAGNQRWNGSSCYDQYVFLCERALSVLDIEIVSSSPTTQTIMQQTSTQRVPDDTSTLPFSSSQSTLSKIMSSMYSETTLFTLPSSTGMQSAPTTTPEVSSRFTPQAMPGDVSTLSSSTSRTSSEASRTTTSFATTVFPISSFTDSSEATQPTTSQQSSTHFTPPGDLSTLSSRTPQTSSEQTTSRSETPLFTLSSLTGSDPSTQSTAFPPLVSDTTTNKINITAFNNMSSASVTSTTSSSVSPLVQTQLSTVSTASPTLPSTQQSATTYTTSSASPISITTTTTTISTPASIIHGGNLKPAGVCAQYIPYGYIKVVEGVCFILGGTDTSSSDGFLSSAEAASFCTSIPNGRLVTIADNVQWLAVRKLHNIGAARSPSSTSTWVDLQGQIGYQSQKYWYNAGSSPYSRCSDINNTPVGFDSSNDTTFCTKRNPYICAVIPCPIGQQVVMGSGLDSSSDYACDDNYPCTYIDKKQIQNYTCNSPEAGICVDNTNSSRYKCLCDTGYRDTDAAVTNSACTEIADCTTPSTCGKRSDASSASSCSAGYQLVTTAAGRSTCVDIDECSVSPLICGPNYSGVCVNFLGSYICRCYGGFQHSDPSNLSNSPCVDIHECDDSNTCGQNQMRGTCIEQIGNYQCVCKHGYQLAPQSWDNVGQPVHDCIIDQCAHSPYICGSNGSCVTLPLGYRCDCSWGYHNTDASRTVCVDIDECVQTPGICGDPASGYCVNFPGSYRCACSAGYQSISYGRQCIDIDECMATPDLCGIVNGTCVNTPGSYHCNCFAGYQNINGGTACVDIDECQQNPIVCGTASAGTCHNTLGYHYCSCNDGYQNRPVRGAVLIDMYSDLPCVDIPECDDPNACAQSSKVGNCTELPGSYKCTCLPGYKVTPPESYHGHKQCTDIDECRESPGICGVGATCSNLPGRYWCTCNAGYRTQPGTGACLEINQCEENPNICGPGWCTKYRGGIICQCQAGYQHSNPNDLGSVCVDVRECDDPTTCNQNKKYGVCVEKPGTYGCNCAKGYKAIMWWSNLGMPAYNCVPR